MPASDGVDSGHAREPRLLAGVVALKFLDGVLLGVVVFCILLLFKHGAPHAYHAISEPLHRAAADLTTRARADARRFEPSAVPIILLALDDDDAWESHDGRPSQDLLRVIEMAAEGGAAAIVVDHFFREQAAIDCVTMPALCRAHFPPIILPAEVKQISSQQTRQQPFWAQDAAPQDAPAHPPHAPGAPAAAFKGGPPDGPCGAPPNLWFGHVYVESDGDGVQRQIAPFVWMVPERAGQAPPHAALPALPLLAARFAALREATRAAPSPPAGNAGDAQAAAAGIASLRAAFPLAQRCQPSGAPAAVRIGRTDVAIAPSAQTQPIRYAFNAPAPGDAQSVVTHGYLRDNRATYRALPFRLVLNEATNTLDTTPPSAPPPPPPAREDPYRDTVVVIGQISGGSDIKSTPLGPMAGPVVIANAIRSLGQFDPPGAHGVADALLELAVIAITAAVFAVLFWVPVTLWRRHVSPLVAIRSERALMLLPRSLVFLLVAAAGAGWLGAAIAVVYLTIDYVVAPMFWGYVAAGGEVDFVLPAGLIVLKGIVEASKLFVDGLTAGSRIIGAALLPRARPTLAAALKAVEHPHE